MILSNSIKHRKYELFALLFFLIALFFRIHNIASFISYHQDQVRDLLIIKKHFQTGQPILLGPKASVGNFFLPPFWYLLMSAAYFVSADPLSPAIMTAFLSSLTAPVIYLLGKSFLNHKIAILSALLFSVSHLSIEYSRFSWNPNPIPLFVALTFFFFFKYQQQKKPQQLAATVTFANLATQLHFEGAPLLIFILLALIVFYSEEKNTKLLVYRLAVYILTNLILLFPYIYYELTHSFTNTKGILQFVNSGSSLKFFGFPFFIKYLALQFPIVVSRILLFNNYYLGVLISAFLGIMCLSALWSGYKHQVKKADFWLSLFFLSSLALLFFYKNSLIDYYLLFLLPIIIILFVSFLSNKLRFLGSTIIAAMILTAIFKSPTFGKTDGTYLAIKNKVQEISKQQNYCLTYYIFPETFIESKFRYLFSISKYPPKENMSCLPMFYLCESALCNAHKTIHTTLVNAALIYTADATGVYIYKKPKANN